MTFRNYPESTIKKPTGFNRGPGFTSLLPWSVFLVLIALLYTSCGSIKDPEFLGVDRFRISRLGREVSLLSMDLRYQNPNKSGLQLKSAAGSIWLDGRFLGDFKTDTGVRIPSRGPFIIPVTLEVNMKRILENSISVLLDPEVTVKLEGKARVGKGLIFLNYPIRYEGKQDLSKLLME